MEEEIDDVSSYDEGERIMMMVMMMMTTMMMIIIITNGR